MSWIRIPKPNPTATIRLFVFHHAGGMGNAYFQWHALLPPEAELLILDLPGRGMLAKEKKLEDFLELLPKLQNEIEPFLERPFILFGHSLGALLALELARRLPKSKLSFLRGLALSAFKPPTEKNLNAHLKISNLPEEEFIKKMNEIAPLPKEMSSHPETLAYFLSLMRSDLKVVESYSPNPDAFPIELKALIFGGDADPQIPTGTLTEWNRFVNVQEKVRIFPGNHFFVFPNAQAVIDDIFKSFAHSR